MTSALVCKESCATSDQSIVDRLIFRPPYFVDSPLFRDEKWCRHALSYEIPEPDIRWFMKNTDWENTQRIPSPKTVLSKEKEREIFLRYNYIRFLLNEAIKETKSKPTISDDDKRNILSLHENAISVRNKIVCYNLALSIFIGQRFRKKFFLPRNLDCFEIAHRHLIFAAERHDGTKSVFATYASTSMWRGMLREMYLLRKKDRAVCFSENTDKMKPLREDGQKARSDAIVDIQDILRRNTADLTDRQIKCIRAKFFGVDENTTLSKIGDDLNTSRQVVRLELDRAFAKMRTLLDPTV